MIFYKLRCFAAFMSQQRVNRFISALTKKLSHYRNHTESCWSFSLCIFTRTFIFNRPTEWAQNKPIVNQSANRDLWRGRGRSARRWCFCPTLWYRSPENKHYREKVINERKNTEWYGSPEGRVKKKVFLYEILNCRYEILSRTYF